MKCKAARRLFSAYMDREMSFEEEAGLRRHLNECADCENELAKVQRMVAMLNGLPEIEVGDQFYVQLQGKLRRAEAAEAPALAEPALPWAERLRAWFGAGWLRPALGGALGLLVGIVVGSSVPQLGTWLEGAPVPGTGLEQAGRAANAEQPATTPSVPVAEGIDNATVGSPLADLDLTHLAAISDTVRLGSEPELILKRYVSDPQRDLIRPEPDYRRMVTGGADGQSDVFITF